MHALAPLTLLAGLALAPGARPQESPTSQAWVGTLVSEGRAVPYLLRTRLEADGRTLGATLDCLERIAPADAATSVEQADDSLSVFFEGGGRSSVLVLERAGTGLEGLFEVEGFAEIRASFVPMADLASVELARLAGVFVDADGRELFLAPLEEEGVLVARFPAEARCQMLFPADARSAFAGAGPTLAHPASLAVRWLEATIEWSEGGTTRAFRRVERAPAELRLGPDALTLGELLLPLAPIPAGTFRMGQLVDDEALRSALGLPAAARPGAAPDPVRTTTLTRSFRMSRVEVTQAWFAAFVVEAGHMTDAERLGSSLAWNGTGFDRVPGLSWQRPGLEVAPSAPVVHVSWNDAVAFCAWLARRTQRVVRLPTEAEWEYACAAGTDTLFSCGDDPAVLEEHAWFHGNAQGPRPVGTKRANPWGLHDLHGNVWEWCLDVHAPIRPEPATDPRGPAAGPTRILRGGSWINGPVSLRSAFRPHEPPTLAEPHIGFRLVVEDD